MTTQASSGSSSLHQADYWWYRARAELLEVTLGPFMGLPTRILDVGSADGPSVQWMRGRGHRVAVDVEPRGLTLQESVCASAMALPFPDETFDVVAAFDVVEHCAPEHQALAELNRVLVPGGRLLMSVPAYQWAWTDHDVRAGHHRRYTRSRLRAVVTDAGLDVRRSTYAFGSVFPFFVAERIARRVRRRAPDAPGLTVVPTVVDRLLMGLSALDRRILRRYDLPFGSSIFLAAVKPGRRHHLLGPLDTG